MPQYQTDKSGKRVEPGDEGYNWGERGTRFDPVADAKGFLADPSRSQAPQPSAEDTQNAYDMTNVPREGMSLRGLTDIMESTALPLAGMGMIPSPLSPFLLGASGAMAGAGGLRKLIAPAEDESRVGGGVQTALALAPFAGSLSRGIRGIGQLPMKRFPISGEVPYRMGMPQAMNGLNEAQPSLRALEELAASTTPPKVRPSALEGLPESWKQFASNTPPTVGKERAATYAEKAAAQFKAPKPPATHESNRELLRQLEQAAQSGATRVPGPDPQMAASQWYQDLPKGGLESITPAEWKKLGMRQVRQTMPRKVDVESGWGGENLNDLMNARGARLNVPARARAFREQNSVAESPFQGLMPTPSAGMAAPTAVAAPRLARIADEGGSIQLGFHGKAVTPDDIVKMFPTSRISVQPKKAFGTGRDYFKVEFIDKNGNLDYAASKDAVKSLGGHLYYE